MESSKLHGFIKVVLNNMPQDWLKLTTHRLDIYNESLAKTEFLELFENLYNNNISDAKTLFDLPTAYDYIRLGHPLSCVLEWVIAKNLNTQSENVISFSSNSTPILAVLRKNLFLKKNTQITYSGNLPANFNAETIQKVYGYNFELKQVNNISEVTAFNGSVVYVSNKENVCDFKQNENVDFVVNLNSKLGSIILISEKNAEYISEIQHVRRRETIAMTPINCLFALNTLVGNSNKDKENKRAENKKFVTETINNITNTNTKSVVGSSGLSIQYAIMMGLVENALVNHAGKQIKIVVPPNCYGGTNDQARRVAACLENVDIMDLPVDGDNDMVQSIEQVLTQIAKEDAVPYIIAEIPTNPRVEVPNLEDLKNALSKERKTPNGDVAVDPVFILDQTFCPNVHFLGDEDILASVRTIVYASGSKFPSGGKCTAGFCVGNTASGNLMDYIEKHLTICDNEATDLQYEYLAEQMPSMLDRISGAYKNTREFVNFIEKTLPDAKINFVSEELAEQGFTPSVFSLDLPTKGNTDEERETYKRELNHKLINLMINEIPTESKYCVSYGQLKGCYWTIPATSTQGTTKEGDKDYIARVALSANMDLEKHKEVFAKFVNQIILKKTLIQN